MRTYRNLQVSILVYMPILIYIGIDSQFNVGILMDKLKDLETGKKL